MPLNVVSTVVGFKISETKALEFFQFEEGENTTIYNFLRNKCREWKVIYKIIDTYIIKLYIRAHDIMEVEMDSRDNNEIINIQKNTEEKNHLNDGELVIGISVLQDTIYDYGFNDKYKISLLEIMKYNVALQSWAKKHGFENIDVQLYIIHDGCVCC